MSHPNASTPMKEAQGQSRNALEDSSPRQFLNAELALVMCARAWDLPGRTSSPRSPWASLEPALRDRIQTAWETIEGAASPALALQLLRGSHRSQCRVDLGQLHPSWRDRALQDESPAVRGLLAAQAPEVLTTPASEAGNRDPDAEVVGWVLALWAERLVGGEPVCQDEPPVIIALASLSSLERYRLCQAVGLAKTILAAGLEPMKSVGPAVQARSEWLVAKLKSLDARAQEWACREVQAMAGAEFSPRRQLALMGLATLARLLADCHPFRTRWTLQHLPYPIAKRIRSLMPSPQRRSMGVFNLESLLLKTAWERLNLERRVNTKHPDSHARERDDY